MRLQVAIDRVNLKTAEAMIEEMRGMADIIEVGTSLIKDYGLENSVARFKKRFPDQCFLADIKTATRELMNSGRATRQVEIFQLSWDFPR